MDPHLRKVYVKGEVSNVKYHSNGHIYFTLKDAGSRISCAMFSTQAKSLSFRAEEGMNVFVTGDISLFESAGNYQFYVKSMEPDGIGALFVAFEQLKQKLEQEGLFSKQFKLPIPSVPSYIGVITSPTGAAIRDILTTLERRFPLASVTVFSALVQGTGAAASIVKAIERANSTANLDVLIVGRGGGSIEDLWAFNEEPVARAIAKSKIPIISAVGHETDTTIADFVADLRAPTPTAAAELAVPNQFQLRQFIDERKLRLRKIAAVQMQQRQTAVKQLQNSIIFTNPSRMYRPFVEQHVHLMERLERSLERRVEKADHSFAQLRTRLAFTDPTKRIELSLQQLKSTQNRLQYIQHTHVKKEQQQFVDLLRTLEALSPIQTMRKGFVVTQKDGKLVKSIENLQPGDHLLINYHDGSARAIVQSTEKEEDHELNF